MKNGLLVWNILLTLVAGYLLIAHFSHKESSVGSKRSSVRDTSMHAPFSIAYFEMDSVETNFQMVKDVKAEIAKQEEDYTNKTTELDWTFNNKLNEYKQTAKSQADVEAAQEALRSLSETIKGKKQELDQKYQFFVTSRNLLVKNAIQTFMTKYNEGKNYSYIVAYEQGLFYYKDTAYNITEDVISGLNAEYAKTKGKKQ